MKRGRVYHIAGAAVRWGLGAIVLVLCLTWFTSRSFSWALEGEVSGFSVGHGLLFARWDDSLASLPVLPFSDEATVYFETAPPLPESWTNAEARALGGAVQIKGRWSWSFDWQLRSGMNWVQIPLWSVALAIALPAAVLWTLHVRRRRAAAAVGTCSSCGYDVSSLAAGPCPECGAPRGGTPG